MTRIQKFGQSLLPVLLLVALCSAGVWGWHRTSYVPPFDPAGISEDDLAEMEMNGEVVRTDDDLLIYNPDRQTSFPGPEEVWKRVRTEFGDPFHKKGTNDHGIGWLLVYSLTRFAIGFVLASVVAVVVGTLVGLSPFLFQLLNPIVQILRPISPVAWMPLMLFSVKDSTRTAVLVIFLAALWPTLASTAFGVQTMRKDYLQVAKMLELSWLRRVLTVILPAAGPSIVAGLRISFASALIALVPVEMLLGELGVGYLIWNYWNTSDIAGVFFAILVIGMTAIALDLAFQRAARLVSYAE